MSEHLLAQGTRGPTSQRTKAPLTDQVPNDEGGFVWAVDHWTRLRRFLILGSEGGTYYATEKRATSENVACVRQCIAEDGPRTVEEIVAVSEGGRAPKNDSALFALASCMALGDRDTKLAAGLALPRVARIGTHLFDFVAYAQSQRGWGVMLRKAIQNWYESKPAEKLAYDVIKYRQRNGWSHRDVLRLAHPLGPSFGKDDESAESPTGHGVIYDFITHGNWDAGAFPIIDGFVAAQNSESPADTAALIRRYGLPREALLTEHLNDIEVWKAMLDSNMPIMAMTRNLATMTRNGVLGEVDYRKIVTAAFADQEKITKSRLHPFSILLAMTTYRSGKGFRGGNTWTPISAVTDALDQGFYLAFGNVEPTGKRMLLGLDVSGSMNGSYIAGSNLSALEGTGAMAMVTAAVEEVCDAVTFSHATGNVWGRTGGGFRTSGLEPMDLSKRRRLDDLVMEMYQRGRAMGGTDCALPIMYALANKLDYDAFVIYTDSETWAGNIHPFEAIRKYRAERVPNAKLVVVGMTSNGFTIADPNDAGMMDVVGFDTATPNMISDFVAGRL